MKKLFHKLLHSWRFYALSRNEYRECMKESFAVNNYIGLWQSNVALAVICICFSLFPVFVENEPSKAVAYFTTAAISSLLAFISRYQHRQYKLQNQTNRTLIYVLIVLYFINIMFSGLYIGVIATVGPPIAIVFICYLIVSMLLFAISPVFNACLTAFTVAAFTIFTFPIREPQYVTYELAGVLLAAILGLFFGWQINRYRLLSVIARRNIENLMQDLPGVVFQHLYNPPEYTFTFVSDACTNLTGYTADELIGKSAVSFLEMHHPNGSNHIENLIKDTLLKDLVYEDYFRITTRDGGEKWIWERSHVTEKNADGSPHLISGYYTDVTEQRNIETAKLASTMLMSSSMCCHIMDKDLNVVDCNDVALSLYGYDNKQEHLARFFDDCFPEFQPNGKRSYNLAIENINKAFEEGRHIFTFLHQKRVGTLFPAEITLIRIDHKGNDFLACYTYDLSRIIDMEKRLEAALIDSQAANWAKGEFMSRMSHEMRTPMNAIIGMASIMKMGTVTAEQKECIDEIDYSSSQLLQLIDDVLDYSDMDFGIVKLEEYEFSFGAMLEDILGQLSRNIDEKKHKLTINVDKSIPAQLYGDEKRLSKVILNILENSVKYTPDNGIISLSAKAIADDNGVSIIQVEVIDNGIGISDEQQQKLFDLFEQLDGGYTRRHGGIGLGLSFSKSIVEMMGGKIWVESQPNEGSKFVFTCKIRSTEVAHQL